MRRRVAVALFALCLAGCGSMPVRRTYVLGGPPPVIGVRSERGVPVIELRAVSVPDYLDTTDILRRAGPNEVGASETGRWGERLSLGLADALVSALLPRLPGRIVTSRPVDNPARSITVEVESFDIAADGRCLLAARWRIADGGRGTTSAAEFGAFSEIATPPDDSSVAAAMTRAVDQLAERIAATLDGE